jgi:hypothetical protein
VSKGFGSFECDICEANTYSGAGEVNCTACPVGKVTDDAESGSIDECQSKCDFGSFSLTGLRPCTKCPLGTFNAGKGVTGCTLCPRAQFMPLTGASHCWDCPPGRGTIDEGTASVDFCVGIAEKPLNSSICTAEGVYRRDEGRIETVFVVDPGRGNPAVSRLEAVSRSGGFGFDARVTTDANGSVTKIELFADPGGVPGGAGYTSQDTLDLTFQNVNDPSYRAVERVTGSITSAKRRAFVDLGRTPYSYQYGCSAGTITAGPAVGGARIEYRASDGALSTFCFGRISPGGLCVRDLAAHGGAFVEDPPFLLAETAEADAGACRCGSGVEEVALVSGGAGYAPGRLVAFMRYPDACLPYASCTTGVPQANVLYPPGWQESNFTNASCPAWCASALAGGANFSGAVEVARERCLGNIYNGSLCNGSSVTDPTGAVAAAAVLSPGWGFNETLVDLAVAYEGAVRCDAGAGAPRSDCLQEGTVSGVHVLGAGTVPAQENGWGVNASLGRGRLVASCAGVNNCTGAGLAGSCILAAGSREIVAVEIDNHGTGCVLFPSPPAVPPPAPPVRNERFDALCPLKGPRKLFQPLPPSRIRDVGTG